MTGLETYARPLSTPSKRAPSITRTSLRVFEAAVFRPVVEPANPNCDTDCDTPLNVSRSLTATPRSRRALSSISWRRTPRRCPTNQKNTVNGRAQPADRGCQVASSNRPISAAMASFGAKSACETRLPGIVSALVNPPNRRSNTAVGAASSRSRTVRRRSPISESAPPDAT